MQPYPIPPNNHPMAFNYNINMFINPFYTHHPYSMMNPWMDWNQIHHMNHMNQVAFPKIYQNYLMEANMQHNMPRLPFAQSGFQFQSEEKQEVLHCQHEVIVIDDDESEKV
jgi:hypothetical protein